MLRVPVVLYAVLCAVLGLSTDTGAESVMPPAASAAHAQSPQLSILLTEWPVKFDPKKQELQGPGADIIREIAERSGVKLNFKMYPRARAVSLAQIHNNTCILAARTSVEHLHFKWSATIIYQPVVFLVSQNSSLKLDHVSQAQKLRIGALKGSFTSLKLKQLGFKVEESTDVLLGLRKLELGRLDIWATIDLEMSKFSKKAGVSVPKKLLIVETAEIAYACNRNVMMR